MYFPTISSDGISIVCFLADADWSKQISISHFFPVEITTGLSDRESRRPAAEQQLLSAAVTITLNGQDAEDLRNALATIGTGWVGLPIWADQFYGSDFGTAGARIYDAQRLVSLSAGTIVPSTSGLVPGDLYAPLIVGHITTLPSITPVGGADATCSFTLTEDSPWTFRVGIAATVAAGTWPSALAPDWTAPPVETPVAGLTFERIGQQREQQIGQIESAFRWTSESGFTFTTKAEIATFLAFFVASRGPWAPFTTPFWFTPGAATTDAPNASTMRFTEDTVTVMYSSSQIAEVKVKVSEVPWEILGTAGEVPQQPARIFLYQITHATPYPTVWRFTNCWRPLTRTGDGTYTPAPMQHDIIDGGLDLSNEGVKLNSFIFPGNPLDLFNPNVLEGKMTLSIYEIETDPINADAATLAWYGAIANAPQTGRKYSASCLFMGGILDREGPAVRIGPACNTWFTSSRCGHTVAEFSKAGTFLSSAGVVTVVTTTDAAAANTYAPGTITVGTGATWESRSILSSAPVAGGQQFTLDRPIRQAASGQSVTYYRICDRSVATCIALDPAGWKARFRGHPNLPLVALTLPIHPAAGGGKK